ncbi:MAG: cytochrome P450 [Firmicutes bacterium]|nr:cytochrome P450 [Alicyclobacillaceae bacterium]MCL6498140.1 cytochrome P450 [Bacillota bacterium]
MEDRPVPTSVGGPGFRTFWALRRDPLAFFTDVARKTDLADIQVGPRRFLLVSHPEDIAAILITQHKKFIKGRGLQFTRPVLGNGLLTSEGEFWQRQRRLAQPAFHRDRLASYARDMVRVGEALAEEWRAGGVRDVARDTTRLALAIAGKTLFNVEVGPLADQVHADLGTLMRYTNRRIRAFVPLPTWLPTPASRRFRHALSRLDAVIYDIIRQREATGKTAGDVLDRLMAATDEAGGHMSHAQLRDEVMTLFLAGHETTANGLAWTFYLIAQHPEVQERLHQEWEEVLHGRSPDPGTVERLPYTQAVIQEGLRLYPPAWMMARQAVAPFTLRGYEFPAGTQVVMSQWVMHRHPRYHPEPERFWPDRWLDRSYPPGPGLTYFPFGAGPRLCIGRPFALLEMALLLPILGQVAWLSPWPKPPVVPEPLITLRPKYGLSLRLEPLPARADPRTVAEALP